MNSTWITPKDMDREIVFICVHCKTQIQTVEDKIKLRNGECPGCERLRIIQRNRSIRAR